MSRRFVLLILLAVIICILVGTSVYLLINFRQALAWKVSRAGILAEIMNPTSLADDQLMLGVSHHDAAQVEGALKNGADPNHRGLGNETQLMMACQYGDVQSAEALLKHGAEPDLKDEGGFTALMIACQTMRPGIVQVVLENGANPNLRIEGLEAKSIGIDGYTALMIACRSSDFKTVQALLDHGADPRCVGADGKTALDLVKQRGTYRDQASTIELLEQRLK